MAPAKLDAGAIIEAAARMADRDGLDSIALSALAREFGVQPASLYSHVRDRAAVLDGVQVLALDQLADRLADAIAGRSGRAALEALALAHRTFAAEFPGRWAALTRRPAPSTVVAPTSRRVPTLMWAVLRAYPVADDELVHASRMLGATINGLITLERSGSFDHRGESIDLSWTRCLHALDAVLRVWPSVSSESDPP